MPRPQSLFVLVGLGLAGLLLWQVLEYGRVREFSKAHPIRVGAPFPIHLEPADGHGRAQLECGVAFVIDPDCGHCAILASRLGKTSSGPQIQPLWIAVGNPSRNREFADSLGLTSLFRPDFSREISASSILHDLNLPVVPTRLWFGADGEVVDIRITQSLDAPETRDPRCDSGPYEDERKGWQ